MASPTIVDPSATVRSRFVRGSRKQFTVHETGSTPLVEAGEGVTLVPACVSNLRGNGVVLRPVEPDTARIPLMMVWPEDRENRACRSFVDLVREQAETIRGMLPGRRRR